MFIQEKKINFKVSKNGKFQLTGCREVHHAKMAMMSFLEIIHSSCPETITFERPPIGSFSVYMEIVMTNMDCCTGYCINRQNLDRIINTKTPFHSLLETSFGYTGVNIKFPVQIDLKKLKIPLIEWIRGQPDTVKDTFMDMSLIVKDKLVKYNTFLVFHSGQFIMSGMFEDTMRDDYNRFMSILRENEESVREILDV
jgi:TATA-box binding protein (TBP) (component of TFIID and TFIIIB)